MSPSPSLPPAHAPGADERLIAVPAQSGSGLLGAAGVLVLTAQVLRFTPRSSRPSWLGGGAVEIPLRSVEGISVEGGLAVEAAGRVHRFSGGSVAPLALQLESLLLGMRGEAVRFPPLEGFLVHGPARWEREGGTGGQGHVMLVRDRLIWWTGQGEPEGCGLKTLRAVAIEEATGAVVVDDGAQELLIRTAVAAPLCAWLMLALDRQGIPDGSSVHTTGGGALGGEGCVAVGGGRLILVRGGRGGRTTPVPEGSLVSVSERGTAVELAWTGGMETLQFADRLGVTALWDTVLARMERWRGAGLGWGGAAPGQLSPGPDGEAPRWMRPALRVEDGLRQCGSLVLTEDHLAFVPAHGSGAESLPVDGLVRARGVAAAMVGVVGRRAAYRLSGPADEVDGLWGLVHAPARLLTGRALTPAALARLQGEAAWLRLGGPGDEAEVLEFGETRLTVRERTIRLELEGRPPRWMKPGVALHIELGRREGLTHVHAAARRVQPGARTWRLDLEPPDRIEIFNKREAYRAPAEGQAELRDEAGTVVGRAELRDVSASGIGLRNGPAVVAGQRLVVGLVIPEEAPVSLPARVVRCTRHGGGRVIGLKVLLEEVDEARSTALAALVMRLQLAWLARRLGEGDMDPDS